MPFPRVSKQFWFETERACLLARLRERIFRGCPSQLLSLPARDHVFGALLCPLAPNFIDCLRRFSPSYLSILYARLLDRIFRGCRYPVLINYQAYKRKAEAFCCLLTTNLLIAL